jgi:hypothetical protein
VSTPITEPTPAQIVEKLLPVAASIEGEAPEGDEP